MAIGCWVLTRSTLTPFDNIGVMTMKMISSTSITSTMGVTLMSLTGAGACCFFLPPCSLAIASLPGNRQDAGSPVRGSLISTRRIPEFSIPEVTAALLARAGAALRPLQEVVDQLGTGVAHLHVERFNLAGEEVVHPDRGDGHKETDSRRHQGFGNTAGHCAQTSRLLGGNSLERVDDADNGSKQSHEGSGGTDGCQTADATLEFGVHDGFGAFEGALGSFDLFARNLRADLMSLEFLQTGHHNLGEVALLVAIRNLHGFIQFAFAQRAGNRRSKCAGLFASGAVGHHADDHDANRIGRHEE